MKKIKISALLFVLGAGLAFAQGPRGEHPRGDMMKNHIERLDSIVDLTDDQMTEIQTLNEAFKVKMKEARTSKDRVAMKVIRDQHKSDVEKVLTPEQVALLKASREAHRSDMKEMRSEIKKYKNENIKPTLKTKRAEFDNNLSDEEKETINALRTELKEMRKGSKDDEAKRPKRTKEEREVLKLKLDAALSPIVIAHQTELTQMEADLAPLKATWEADIKEIKSNHSGQCEGKCDKKGGKRHRDHKATKDADKASMHYYRFLLMKFE